jgi:predicted nucleic acid-binding protein
VIVVDASVLAPALADDTSDGDAARLGLRGQALAAPELIDLEVVSVWRRQVMAGQLEARRAQLAMTDLLAIPLQRISHRNLIARCWELRQNLTP